MAGLLDSPISGQLREGGAEPGLQPAVRQIEDFLENPLDGEYCPRGSQDRGRWKTLPAQDRLNFLEGCQRIGGQIDPAEGLLQVETGSRQDRSTRPEGLWRTAGPWWRALQEMISESPGPRPSFGNQREPWQNPAEI